MIDRAGETEGAERSPSYAIIGRVRHAHGVRGEVVVEPITDAPDVLLAPGRRVIAGTRNGDPAPGAPVLTVRRSQPFKQGFIVAFEEIADRNAADLWRGRFLLVPLDELPPPDEDEVFLHQLPGLQVFDVRGEALGVVRGWFELPHDVLLEIEREGTVTLFPYREEFVREVDLEARRLVIEPPEGLFDQEQGMGNGE